MTDFVTWWADHWPLVPILALYPFYAIKLLEAWATVRERAKRGRMP